MEEIVGAGYRKFDEEEDAFDLRAIANGDRLRFRSLYERYEPLLRSIILRILNDREDAEEVLQEVSFSLWNKAGQYNSAKGKPATWLTSMARNRAIDRIRARQRQAKLKDALAGETEFLPSLASGYVTGYEAAKRRDNCQAVRSAVLELTDVQREALQLAYFDGFTQKEIATQLGQPVGTIKARIRRGLEKLRQKMKPA